jgi:4-amino-4-deoxychorismate lyase
MKIFSHRQKFEYRSLKFFITRIRHHWEAVTLALFQKYPNPFTSHVLSIDVLSRHIDVEGRLHSTRLLLKTAGSGVPTWLQSLIKSKEAYVLEVSIVDPKRGTMETHSHNLSHRRFMSVEEIQTFSKSLEDDSW